MYHPEDFVSAVQEQHPDIVAMSALLTTTMSNLKVVIDALKEAGVRDQVKVWWAGHRSRPAMLNKWRRCLRTDASRAVSIAKSLIA